MKKKSEYIILTAVILFIVVGNFVDIRIPFLDDSPLGDFLGKAATIYFSYSAAGNVEIKL